jgi:ribulose kinase
VLATQCSEPVLLGSAILGAVAGNIAPSVTDAMKQFTHVDKYYYPHDNYQPIHLRRYEAYKQLQQTATLIRD